jgi:eukaryotic-like serine/threonine-protein kinase
MAEEGQRLGRYTIVREIASGGMATVFLARQQGPVGFSKPVALKRMHPHIAKDPDFATMFYDEATLAARIQHPNVVATLDVVAHEGEAFIVMEYVDGGALATLIRDKKRKRIQVDVAIAVSIMCEVLAGLHAAHEARNDEGTALEIVHRDVSPQNILLGRDGLARVVDFGVAKAAVRSGVTKDQGVKGKLCYMSPEQVSGQGVDRRADIFAAAAVLFELLAGRRLFIGDDPGALIGAVIMSRVPPLSDFRADVPAGVEEAMRRALAAKPEARYSDALAFADALEDAVPKLLSRRRLAAWVNARAQEVFERRAARKPSEPAAALPPEEEGTAVMPDRRQAFASLPEPIVDRALVPSGEVVPPEPLGQTATIADPAQVPTGDTGNSGHIVSVNMPTPYSQVSLAAGTSVSLPSPPMVDNRRTIAIVAAVGALLVVMGAMGFLLSGDEPTSGASHAATAAPDETTATDEPRPTSAETTDVPETSAAEQASVAPSEPSAQLTTTATATNTAAAAAPPKPVGTSRPPKPRPAPKGTYLPDLP